MKNVDHCDIRRSKLLKAYYASKKMGTDSYEIDPNMKSQLYKTFCRSILFYGLESLYLNQQEVKKMQTLESNTIKGMLKIDRRTRSTQLLYSMRMETIRSKIDSLKLKFFSRLLQNEVTNELLFEIYNICTIGKIVRGKWTNFITEVNDICVRVLQEERVEMKLNTSLNNTFAVLENTRLPAFDDIIENVKNATESLKKQKERNFSLGTAETIRYLLQKKHDGKMNGNDQKLLELLLRAFEKKEEI
jgi:hypothetical protein